MSPDVRAPTYTFGDSDLAGERLRWLAAAYEPPTRDLLLARAPRAPAHALDLGCGPGHTTRLLHETLAPALTTGIDSSPRFIAEAQRTAPPGVSFAVRDLLRPPFSLPEGDLLFCRHLLAHVADVPAALAAWAELARPQARLIDDVRRPETVRRNVRFSCFGGRPRGQPFVRSAGNLAPDRTPPPRSQRQ